MLARQLARAAAALRAPLAARTALSTRCGVVQLVQRCKSLNLGSHLERRRRRDMDISLDQRQALDLWRRVTVSSVRSDEPDLTARQMAVLMTVHLAPGPHTVRGLATTLRVGKP